MSSLLTCRTHRELTGNIWVYYSEPDPRRNDHSHDQHLPMSVTGKARK